MCTQLSFSIYMCTWLSFSIYMRTCFFSLLYRYRLSVMLAQLGLFSSDELDLCSQTLHQVAASLPILVEPGSASGFLSYSSVAGSGSGKMMRIQIQNTGRGGIGLQHGASHLLIHKPFSCFQNHYIWLVWSGLYLQNRIILRVKAENYLYPVPDSTLPICTFFILQNPPPQEKRNLDAAQNSRIVYFFAGNHIRTRLWEKDSTQYFMLQYIYEISIIYGRYLGL